MTLSQKNRFKSILQLTVSIIAILMFIGTVLGAAYISPILDDIADIKEQVKKNTEAPSKLDGVYARKDVVDVQFKSVNDKLQNINDNLTKLNLKVDGLIRN